MASAVSRELSITSTYGSHASSSVTTYLTSEELSAYGSYTQLLHFWGWQLSEKPSHSGEYTLILPVYQGRLLDAKDFRAYLRQLLDTDGKTEIPHSIQLILASVACRSAVMFGDRLDIEQGQRLVDKLKTTQLSFQCAHGRPTMVPLIDMGGSGSRNCPVQCHGSSGGSAMGIQALKAKLLRICCQSI